MTVAPALKGVETVSGEGVCWMEDRERAAPGIAPFRKSKAKTERINSPFIRFCKNWLTCLISMV
jgi:hypothetical protein